MNRNLILLSSLLLSANLLQAEPARGGRGEGKDFHQDQQKERQEHYKDQHEENKDFRNGLKDTEPGQRADAIVDHRNEQYGENKSFHLQQHQENMTFLKDRLAQCKKLTDEQKDSIVSFCETQFGENVSFREERHAKTVDFLIATLKNDSLTHEQKRAAIRDYVSKVKAETQDHRQDQKEERKEFRDSIRPDAPQGKGDRPARR